MSARHYFAVVLCCIIATAGTYLGMHMFVGPNLRPAAVDVPSIEGLTMEQARAITEPLGLLLVVDGQRAPESDKISPGAVFDQRPLAGSRMRVGEAVHVTVAAAVQKVAVPMLVGQPLEAARRMLTEQGLKAGNVTETVSATVAVGMVISTTPGAGVSLRHGEAVELTVSKGGDQVAVPSLRGRGVGAAKQLLEPLGLVLGDVRRGSDDNAADGVILRQNPAPNTLVPRGQKVDIVVNDEN